MLKFYLQEPVKAENLFYSNQVGQLDLALCIRFSFIILNPGILIPPILLPLSVAFWTTYLASLSDNIVLYVVYRRRTSIEPGVITTSNYKV